MGNVRFCCWDANRVCNRVRLCWSIKDPPLQFWHLGPGMTNPLESSMPPTLPYCCNLHNHVNRNFFWVICLIFICLIHSFAISCILITHLNWKNTSSLVLLSTFGSRVVNNYLNSLLLVLGIRNYHTCLGIHGRARQRC